MKFSSIFNYRFLSIIFLAILLFACSDKKENNSSSNIATLKIDSTLTKTPIADQFKLRYKFKKNDLYKYKITTLSTNSQELLTDTALVTTSKQRVEYNLELKVESVDSFNVSQIDIFIKSITVNGDVNGNNILYDSKYILSTKERMMFSQYEALKNQHFKISITNYGDILKVYSTNSILNELLAIQQQKNITKKQKAELNDNFITSALHPLAEQIFRKLPKDDISINYSWNEKYYSQFALFQIENIASFQIKEVNIENGDSVITISAGLSINYIGEHTANQQGMSFYFYDPVVSGGGTIKFNKSLGLVTVSKTSTNMEMVTDITGVDAQQKEFTAKRTDNTSNTNVVKLLK